MLHAILEHRHPRTRIYKTFSRFVRLACPYLNNVAVLQQKIHVRLLPDFLEIDEDDSCLPVVDHLREYNCFVRSLVGSGAARLFYGVGYSKLTIEDYLAFFHYPSYDAHFLCRVSGRLTVGYLLAMRNRRQRKGQHRKEDCDLHSQPSCKRRMAELTGRRATEQLKPDHDSCERRFRRSG